MNLTVEPLSPQNWSALEDLFGPGGASSGCWCMWPRIGRSYWTRSHEENRRELHHLAGTTPSPGLLAFDGEVAVGWCQVAPREDMAWIVSRKQFTSDDTPAWAIGCFFVRRAYRNQGVAGALTEEAIRYAREHGASALEGYPVDLDVPDHTRNTFQGVASTFARHGFVEVARHKFDRPVMRRNLSS